MFTLREFRQGHLEAGGRRQRGWEVWGLEAGWQVAGGRLRGPGRPADFRLENAFRNSVCKLFGRFGFLAASGGLPAGPVGAGSGGRGFGQTGIR